MPLFPIVLHRDLSNGTEESSLNEDQFYIHRLPTKMKKVAHQKKSISIYVDIQHE